MNNEKAKRSFFFQLAAEGAAACLERLFALNCEQGKILTQSNRGKENEYGSDL